MFMLLVTCNKVKEKTTMALLIRMMKPISRLNSSVVEVPLLGQRSADPLDPLANFIKELEHLSSMSGPDISALVSELPVPQDGNVEGM